LEIPAYFLFNGGFSLFGCEFLIAVVPIFMIFEMLADMDARLNFTAIGRTFAMVYLLKMYAT